MRSARPRNINAASSGLCLLYNSNIGAYATEFLDFLMPGDFVEHDKPPSSMWRLARIAFSLLCYRPYSTCVDYRVARIGQVGEGASPGLHTTRSIVFGGSKFVARQCGWKRLVIQIVARDDFVMISGLRFLWNNSSMGFRALALGLAILLLGDLLSVAIRCYLGMRKW